MAANRLTSLVPSSDVFYTLNVLLGLARVPRVPDTINAAEIFLRNAEHLSTLPVREYAFGMALWAAAEHRLTYRRASLRASSQISSDACRL